MTRPLYRVRQFWINLTHRLDEEEAAEIAALLGPSLFILFAQLSPGEQYHAGRVWHTLRQQQSEHDQELWQAALLHDVGKTRVRLNIVERSIYVLTRRLMPAVAAHWGQGEPSWLRRAFVVGKQHADWGANLAAQAGASERVVQLIRRHQDRQHMVADKSLLALMQADDSN